jgi:hypothetical protein
MQRLLEDCSLEKPWKVQPVQWFTDIVNDTFKSAWCLWVRKYTEIQQDIGPGIQAIVDLYWISGEDAKKLVDLLSKGLGPPAYTALEK